MKTLVIYYSYEGSCAIIAAQLKKAANACVLELKTEDEKQRSGFAKYFWGGKQVLTHAHPKLKPYTVTLEEYERVIVGCPVWAGSPAPAMQSFLTQTPITGKRVGLSLCHAGGRLWKSLRRF